VAGKIPPFHWWRTVFYLIPAISVYTIVLGTLSIGASLLGGRGQFAHRCARAWSRLILLTTGVTIEARGLEHVLHDRPALYVSNHQSIYDIPILFWTIAVDLRIIAKQSLGRFPFLGWHLARAGHVLVDRTKPGGDVFRQVSALMTSGVSLLVFPEGTRSADGRVGRFRGGIFLLAIEAGLPVVPVAVGRSRFVMRKGRLMTCPGDVTVQVFPALSTDGLTREDAKAMATSVERTIRTALAGDADPVPFGDAGRDAAMERRA
jgi:1-acyl-sn-glycerol-3-phosphate acyltransferase